MDTKTESLIALHKPTNGYDPAKLEAFGRAIDVVSREHCGADYEEFIMMQAALARLDAAKQKHPAVQSCLDGMAEYLEMAAFNFYASFK